MPIDSSELISKPELNSSGFRQFFGIAIWVSIYAILLLGFLGLSGEVFGIKVLQSVMPNWEPMKIITSICLIFAGTSMIFLQLNRPSIFDKIIPRLLATIICLICLVTIYIYIYLINTGYDSSVTQISFLKFFLGLTTRMAFISACTLFLTGLIILLLSAGNKRASDIAHILIIPVLLISYYVVVSYILGVYSVAEIENVSVSFKTGIAFCCICVATLLMKPNTWLLRVYTSSDTGGVISRRLLLPLMFLPVVIGWLRMKGERISLFESEEGVILVASTYSLSLLILIWLIARYMIRVSKDKYTSAKALLESEERFKAMAESSPVGMGVIKIPEGVFLYLNPSYEQYFGYDKDELLGKNAMEIYQDIKDRDFIYEKLNGNDYVSNYEVRLKRKDGSSFWNMLSIRPIVYNGQYALLGTFVDITERRKAEIELNESKAKLLELIATKDKFFNIVAHDLKNPFTSLLGSSELLYKNIHQMEKESIRELALILNDSAKGGYAILQNLLDWSRSQTGLIKYKPEKIHLNDIIKDNISNLQLQASVKEINLYNNTKEKIIIVSDKNMINAIVRNLLGNALKYTHRRGSVFVKANIKSGEVHISVKDTGIGISKEEIEKLFRLDTKFSNPGTANELGTGLGLKLCREFAEKMGGSIHVESTPDEGSNFVLSIPVK